jgi:hypothetical protein
LETGALPVELQPSAGLIVLATLAGPFRLHPVARGKRPSLGALFLVLALSFGGLAYAAATAGGQAWVIAVASGVLALWMAELAVRTLRS